MRKYPSVSILVAARNEAHQILSCLESLHRLEYPGDWEVWIGNDQSTDSTQSVVLDFISDKSHFHLLDIEGNLGKAQGKANVLAHLAKKATSEVFLFTDADMVVPKTWLMSMVGAWEPGIGTVMGFTFVQGKDLLGDLQSIDWVWALTLIKLSTDLGIPTTALGNNMLVDAEAYRSTGGYESIPFSITEDFALFEATVTNGYGFRQLLSKSVMANTKAIDTWEELMQQRHRWMHGAIKVPWYLRFWLFLQLLWLPIALLGLFIAPLPTALIWGGKWLLSSVMIGIQLLRLGKAKLLWLLPLHELYLQAWMIGMGYRYYFCSTLEWKGRVFAGREV